MSVSLSKPLRKGSGILWSALFLLQACTYRFTNEHIVRPEGIQSIAVEAVWDTSREVVPHEVLWESLQSAFAADGRLKLMPQSSADALVRAHLRTASVGSAGSEIPNSKQNDPRVFDGKSPPSPNQFKLLSQAGEIKDAGVLTTLIDVEVWSLRSRTLLMKRTYNNAASFRAVHADAPATITTRSNDYLRYQESIDAKFKEISRNVSAQVVRDLLVR